MPEITYQVLKKPIEERLIDAACVYWEVERTYFARNRRKDNHTVTYRRRVVCYLIKTNTIYSFQEIANKFGYLSFSRIMEAFDEIEAQKNIYKQIREDINEITHLADKLDADFLTTVVQLHNNKIEVTHG